MNVCVYTARGQCVCVCVHTDNTGLINVAHITGCNTKPISALSKTESGLHTHRVRVYSMCEWVLWSSHV